MDVCPTGKLGGELKSAFTIFEKNPELFSELIEKKKHVLQPDRASIQCVYGLIKALLPWPSDRIKDEAIIGAVELSNRYISNRFLPDKAIDLMDEAASKLRMEINSKPEELDSLDRKIRQIEIELVAIKREKDQKKIKKLHLELSELKEKRKTLFARWSQEKGVVDSIQQKKIEIENLKTKADRAEREGDYGTVAEIRYGKLQDSEEKIQKLQEILASNQSENSLIKEEVTYDDIAEVVAKWTGVPVSKMLQSDKEKLLKLEKLVL